MLVPRENREVPASRIDFTERIFMTVNNRPIEVPDTLPDILGRTVKQARRAIDTQINDIYMQRLESNPQALRPTILVARLALTTTEGLGLSAYGRSSAYSIHTNVRDIDREYHPYWEVLAQNGYYEIEAQSKLEEVPENLRGTWLGVRQPL